MSLKLIPIERSAVRCEIGNILSDKRVARTNEKKQKNFNPGNKINKNNSSGQGSLKNLCLRLVHFINRGSKFTLEQIDEIIMGLEHAVMSLRKIKQDMMRKKAKVDGNPQNR